MSSQPTTSRFAALIVLGVKEDATPQEVTKAYHKAALRTHPDKPGGSDAAFLEVQEAYKLLMEREQEQPTPDTKCENPPRARTFDDLISEFLNTMGIDPDTVTETKKKEQFPWKMCHNFNSPEGCKFGNSCKFFHPKKTCRYFDGTPGSCKNGKDCTFSHKHIKMSKK